MCPDTEPKAPLVAEVSQPKNIRIYFDLDKSDIRKDAIIHLDSVISYMNEFKDQLLQTGGHCDCRGTSEYNMNLSRRRSNSALNYLHDNGIGSSKNGSRKVRRGSPSI